MRMNSRFAGAAAAAIAITSAQAALAGGDVADYGGHTTYSWAIVDGVQVSEDSYGFYSGLFVALNGDLGRSGFVLRILGSRDVSEYTADDYVKIEDKAWQGDIMLGYQDVRAGWDMAVYAGVDFQDHDLSPDDPFNKVRGQETGFKAALDIETNGTDGSPYYALLRGSYSTAFDTYYALGRLGYRMGHMVVGPEAWLLGDAETDNQRIGAFAGFDMDLGRGTYANLTLSGGYEFADENRFWDTANSVYVNDDRDGAYATLQVVFAFGQEHHVPLK